jgi:thiaminase (transcriptional activator TenA)
VAGLHLTPVHERVGGWFARRRAFCHYLVQDYLFLIEFARAYALSIYKSPKLADMREAAAGLSAILDIEMNLHVKLCAGWGLSPSDLEQTPPAAEMLA